MPVTLRAGRHRPALRRPRPPRPLASAALPPLRWWQELGCVLLATIGTLLEMEGYAGCFIAEVLLIRCLDCSVKAGRKPPAVLAPSFAEQQ